MGPTSSFSGGSTGLSKPAGRLSTPVDTGLALACSVGSLAIASDLIWLALASTRGLTRRLNDDGEFARVSFHLRMVLMVGGNCEIMLRQLFF